MKKASCAVALVGVLALILAIACKFVNHNILSVSPRGYVEGAMALFLLSLVMKGHSEIDGGAKSPPA